MKITKIIVAGIKYDVQDDKLIHETSKKSLSFQEIIGELSSLLIYKNKVIIIEIESDNKIKYKIGDEIQNIDNKEILTITHLFVDTIQFRNEHNVAMKLSYDFEKRYQKYEFKKNENFFTDLQKKILNEYPKAIRLEETLRNRNESPKEFLLKFLTDWNLKKKTIYVDDKQVQTDIGKRRSLGDIFMIMKYYYPDFNLRTLIELLYVILPKETGLKVCICTQIHKRVWINNSKNEVRHAENKDEYGYTSKNYTEQL